MPEYRVALFDGLADDDSLDVAVQASERMANDVSVPLNKALHDYGHRMKRIGKFALYWQSGLRLKKATKKGDVLVVCGDLHQLSTFPLILHAKLKGIGVVWWGHHVSARPKAIFVSIRMAIAKVLADCMLCYTEQGCSYLVRRGFDPSRVFSTGNTIDVRKVEAAKEVWAQVKLAEFIKAQGLEGVSVLLFSSVLRQKTRLDILIRALSDLSGRVKHLKCVVIGDGEMRDEYQSLARELGVEDKMIWVGEVRDQLMLAPWFMSASVYVYPGPIGLSLIHAFSYALPVIVNNNANNHGPEYAVFEDQKNGLVFRENDPVDLAHVIEQLLAMPECMKRMGAQGMQVVYRDYSMAQMVARFKAAVLACSRLKMH